jgi:hypothetical protein
MTDRDWTIAVGASMFTLLFMTGVALLIAAWLDHESKEYQRRNRDLQ